ncbi:MAG TPA: ABC transporter ATP-binding protein [Dehalococcoidia bacterium]|nr:ABC transporter ATP-binding protein [Dehalococcoidia bacterium]
MLEIRGLRVAYGEREALRGVDLDVAAGEVVGLVGPNGGGKSTLLKAVTRGVALKAGEVLLGGEDVTRLSAREIARQVAVVPQSPALPVGFLAREIVVMGRTPYLRFLEQEGLADYEKADASLASLGAEALGLRRVEELSGGERQNVVLARALAQETPLLLLDEPTANLDIGHQVVIAKLLRRLAAEHGVGVLAALHDLTLASLYCDRLVLLAAGSVVAEGAAVDVLTRDNLRLAYGADVAVLRPEGLAGPVVLPLEPD